MCPLIRNVLTVKEHPTLNAQRPIQIVESFGVERWTLGVSAEVRLRHGIVVDQVFEEVHTGDYDLIVTGTSQERGLFRHYIMGDLTRSILNRANCPVLVARAGKPAATRTLWKAIKGLLGRR